MTDRDILGGVSYVVLDQNAFTRKSLWGPAVGKVAASGGQLVVLDAALIELTKGDNWLYTYRARLQPLVPYRELVAIGRGLGELINIEFHAREPITPTQLIDRELTKHFRGALEELHANKPGRHLVHFQVGADKARGHAAAEYLDPSRNKRITLHFENAIREGWPEAKPGKIDPTVRSTILSSRELVDLFATALLQSGLVLEQRVAATLAREPSINRHLMLGLASLALRWVQQGGSGNAKYGRFTNDLMDLHYVVPATVCGVLVSEDGNALELETWIRDASKAAL